MIQLPIEPLIILNTLQTHGYDVYIVGGAVRDLLLSERNDKRVSVSDFDFTTNALPEQLVEILPESFYENTYGTVSIAREHVWQLAQLRPEKIQQLATEQQPELRTKKIIDVSTATKLHSSLQNAQQAVTNRTPNKKHVLEITTYRVGETYVAHSRKPQSLQWGNSLSEDLTRRDFSINAMALSIHPDAVQHGLAKLKNSDQHTFQLSSDDYTLVDEHGGIADLQRGVVRTVGVAKDRFAEDALRMLRAVRFSVQLNMKLSEEIRIALKEQSALIAEVSWERIRDEFLRMIASPEPKKALQLLDESGLLQYILPELLKTKGVEQGGHHTTDVWTHSLDALNCCPSQDPVVRLATLLHDIAKPHTYKVINDQPTFYNHEIVGARVARDIARRLKLPNTDVQRVFILVRYHMFHYQEHNTDAAIRRFMRKVGLEHIDDILDVREADRLGSGAKKTSWRLEEMKERMIAQLHQPFAVSDLAIDGSDVMKLLNIAPSKQVGDILQTVFTAVQADELKNETEELLQFVKTNFSAA